MLFISLQPMMLDVGEELHLCIQFNPAYENNLNSWVTERVLRMHSMEITVQGEVCFLNLHLQTKAVDFGYTMNNTEQVLYVEMTNCSPIPFPMISTTDHSRQPGEHHKVCAPLCSA